MRTTIRRRRRCAANRPATSSARAATAPKASRGAQQSTAGHFRRARDSRRRHTGQSRARRGAIDRCRQRTEFDRAAQYPQFRSRSHAVLCEAAGGRLEAPQRRRRARRLAKDGCGRQGHDCADERHGYQALHATGARIHRAQGRPRRSIERAQSGLQEQRAARPRRRACRCGRRRGSRNWQSRSSAPRWCWWWHSWCCGP